ncbi:MAG: HAD family hydrolase [Phycisphaerae bacterium]|nr:HAD family hydrolase [Phycisphaerae bacterium]
MTYEAVLFDLDGTLLDTLDDLADSMNAVLEARGLPTHPTERYKAFVGDGVVALARRALPGGYLDDAELDAVVAEMRQSYAQRWDCKSRPYDGIDAMLNGLAERGLKRAVLSNKPHDFTVLCVERLLAGHTFDMIVGVSDTIPPKPQTRGAEHVCWTLGIEAGRFLYLGDTNTDMQTATATGMFAVGCTWGFRTAEELRDNGADAVVDHPSDVLGLL